MWKQEVNLGCHLSSSVHLGFWLVYFNLFCIKAGSLTGLELTNLARLHSQRTLGLCLSMSPTSEITYMYHHAKYYFYLGFFWGQKLSSYAWTVTIVLKRPQPQHYINFHNCIQGTQTICFIFQPQTQSTYLVLKTDEG